MESKKLKNGPEIDRNTILEDALQIISKSGSKSAVVTKDGESVGSVEITRMIDAIVLSLIHI